MYELKLEKSKFYRVKRGQTAEDIQNTLCIPVNEVFEGMIMPLCEGEFFVYRADVGETYGSIANKFCVREEELKKLNFGKAVYPTCRLYIPRK